MTAGDEMVPFDPDTGTLWRPTAAGRKPDFRPSVLAAVSAGGVLGASARYGLARLWPVAAGRFPWATFWTNVSGSLMLGFAVVVIAERFPPARYARPFVATGFIGAYTTFSTFMVETDVLVRDGHAATGLAYAASSVLAGLGAAWLGISVGRVMSGRAVSKQAGQGE